MKKYLIFLLAIIMLALTVMSVSSCSVLDSFLPSETPEVDPEEPDEPEEPPKPSTVKITYQNGSEKVGYITVDVGTAMTEEQLAKQKALRFEGYGFAAWYTDAALTQPFDPTVTLTEDVTLYGSRGNLAGESIYYIYDSVTRTLTLSGEGEMFDFQYDDGAPWINYSGVIKEIVFDGAITSIGSNSFYGFSAISDIVIPESIVRVGKAAFYRSSLTSVNFPTGLTDIEDYAFFKNEGLTELCFNPQLVNVGKGAFYECTAVESVIMNDRVAFFGNSAFLGCTAIKSVFYMGTEEQYSQITFRLDNFWVQQLTNTFFLSEDKPSARGPFWHYDKEGLPEKWYYTVSLYANNREKVPFTYDYVDPTVGITEENLEFLRTVTYHGYKFASFRPENGIKYTLGTVLKRDVRLTGNRGYICGDSMTWSFSSSTGVLSLMGSGRMWDFETMADAPWADKNVTRVVIGENIEYIGKNAFVSLIDLKTIDIPVTVTDIHSAAFGGCYQLRYIYYFGGVEAALKSKLDLLSGLLEAVVYYYEPEVCGPDGAYWREYNGERVAFIIEGNKLTVGAGSGTMVNYTLASDAPWSGLTAITEVVIRNGVTTVGHNSFNGMSSVVNITMPDSVTRISASAFIGTGYYTDPDNWDDGALYISNHLIRLSAERTSGFYSLRERTVSIAEDAFLGCSSLNVLVINKELQGVYSTAFLGLSSLKELYYEGLESAFGSLYNNSKAAFDSLGEGYTLYYYSPTEPEGEGNYWRYVIKDGMKMITVWEKTPVA